MFRAAARRFRALAEGCRDSSDRTLLLAAAEALESRTAMSAPAETGLYRKVDLLV
jgi:hypothetical protein